MPRMALAVESCPVGLVHFVGTPYLQECLIKNPKQLASAVNDTASNTWGHRRCNLLHKEESFAQ